MRHLTSILTVTATALIGWAALAIPAHADPKPDDERARAEAVALVEQGGALYNAGKFDQALAKFERAHAVYPSPAILMNIGSALSELGRRADAANAYAEFLRDPERNKDKDREIERRMRGLERGLGSVVVRIPNSSPEADAAFVVIVDGQPTRRPAGVPVWVAPGERAVGIARAGETDSLVSGPRTVTVTGKETVEIELAAPAIAPAGSGDGAAPIAGLDGTAMTPGGGDTGPRDGGGSPGRLARIGFWSAAVIGAVSVGVAVQSGLAVGSAEDAKEEAILGISDDELRQEFGAGVGDVCARAREFDGGGGVGGDLDELLTACDDGIGAERRAVIALGVGATAAIAAGLLYWRGYLRPRSGARAGEERAASVTLAPMITPRSLGAAMTLSF